jgi:hypothetical protein
VADEDRLLTRIGQASTLANTGRREEARSLLDTLWAEVTSAGDEFHACVVAHFMAHAQDTAGPQLDWHLRSLRAAERVDDDRVRAFYPSLHANLADTYLRLGNRAAARPHIDRAREVEHVLQEDAYGQTVKGLIARLAEAAGRQDPDLGEASLAPTFTDSPSDP